MDTKGMPKYQCHKIVHAWRIGSIWLDGVDDRIKIIPEDRRFASVELPHTFWMKHKPQPGGYLVVYEDGYESFSPAEAFESGYTRIPLTDRDDPFPKVYDAAKGDWVCVMKLAIRF